MSTITILNKPLTGIFGEYHFGIFTEIHGLKEYDDYMIIENHTRTPNHYYDNKKPPLACFYDKKNIDLFDEWYALYEEKFVHSPIDINRIPKFSSITFDSPQILYFIPNFGDNRNLSLYLHKLQGYAYINYDGVILTDKTDMTYYQMNGNSFLTR